MGKPPRHRCKSHDLCPGQISCPETPSLKQQQWISRWTSVSKDDFPGALLLCRGRGLLFPRNSMPGLLLPTNSIPGLLLPTNSMPGALFPTNSMPGALLPTNSMPGALLPTNSMPGALLSWCRAGPGSRAVSDSSEESLCLCSSSEHSFVVHM